MTMTVKCVDQTEVDWNNVITVPNNTVPVFGIPSVFEATNIFCMKDGIQYQLWVDQYDTTQKNREWRKLPELNDAIRLYNCAKFVD